jgi:hypothetical protein
MPKKREQFKEQPNVWILEALTPFGWLPMIFHPPYRLYHHAENELIKARREAPNEQFRLMVYRRESELALAG